LRRTSKALPQPQHPPPAPAAPASHPSMPAQHSNAYPPCLAGDLSPSRRGALAEGTRVPHGRVHSHPATLAPQTSPLSSAQDRSSASPGGALSARQRTHPHRVRPWVSHPAYPASPHGHPQPRGSPHRWRAPRRRRRQSAHYHRAAYPLSSSFLPSPLPQASSPRALQSQNRGLTTHLCSPRVADAVPTLPAAWPTHPLRA
jgi:hypothetical protein